MVAVRIGICALLMSAVFLAGCGGSDESAFVPLAPQDPGPIHVHALGLNPADGALFIATHTGLYRLAEGASGAERVGGRYQDTMGFSVLGADHFIGSGHPDLREAREEGLPPLLGLIESTDAGESWEPVSLLGEADFHVLRVAGSTVYGFDSHDARLMVSSDGGLSWVEGRPPEALLDLAVDPADPAHLVAAGASGLFESLDGGRAWARLFDGAGVLAWPLAGRLYLVTEGGLVLASADAGKRFSQVGAVGGEPAALLAAGAGELYVALHGGRIERSLDGGASWSVRWEP